MDWDVLENYDFMASDLQGSEPCTLGSEPRVELCRRLLVEGFDEPVVEFDVDGERLVNSDGETGIFFFGFNEEDLVLGVGKRS